QADVVGVLLDNGAQPVTVQQVVLALTQVEHDRRAPLRALDRRERVLPLAGGLPANPVAGGQAVPAGGQGHAVGHDKRGVEADAELADEVSVLTLVAAERLEELAGT